MKAVAVTQRFEEVTDRNELRDSLDQRLCSFIADAGYLPFPVPNSLDDKLINWLEKINPGAILLSGGNNVGDYGSRDRTEFSLLTFAFERKLPVLGICRGMQIMGMWAGASIRPVEGHVGSRHEVTGQINGIANSYHQFALDHCPFGFEVLALSDDGVIEAIGHQQLPWEGWMWHPEREAKFSTNDMDRIRSLFS